MGTTHNWYVRTEPHTCKVLGIVCCGQSRSRTAHKDHLRGLDASPTPKAMKPKKAAKVKPDPMERITRNYLRALERVRAANTSP